MTGIGAFDHPWLGGLFGDAEMAAIWSAEAQMRHMLSFEAAWSRALGAAERVEAGQAEDVARRIEGFVPDMADLAQGTGRDGVPVPALVRQLKGALGPEGIHDGATSQDVIDTALAFAMRDTLALLATRVAALDAALGTLDARFGAAPLMGRTRMQAATPIRVADRLAAWRAPLADHRQRLTEAMPRIGRLQIGGAAGDRAALGRDAGAVVQAMERLLGLPAGERCWHTTRDGVGEVASLLSLVSGSLGKMGQDICLMAQQGLGEITLAGGGGSSAMAHKSNPVAAELLVTLARFNAAQLGGLHQALVHEQERSGAAWALEWMILPQMALATGRGLVAAEVLCASVERMGTAV